MAPPQPLASPTKIPLLQEKALDTPATNFSDKSPPPTPGPQHAHKKNMDGALTSLLWGAFGPCIPVMVVCSVLLTAILYNRIPDSYVFDPSKQTKISNDPLSALHGVQAIENNGGSKAYYLYEKGITNPAVLHTISSWTAKILPFVTGASMALVAFLAGQRIIKATSTKSERLPSPHQVSILINLLNGGGARPLLDTLKYRWQNHEDLVQPVPLAFWSLLFIVAMTFVIGIVDSWFGTATKAINIALVIPSAATAFSFGRSLDPERCATESWQSSSCPSNLNAQCLYPCSMTSWKVSGYEREGLYHAQEAAETLMQNSRTNTILNVTVDDGSNYYFLADLRRGMKLDFVAPTLAIKTECQVVTDTCETHPEGGFTCGTYSAPSFSFSGQVGMAVENATAAPDEAMVGIQFFNDSAWTQPVGLGSSATDLFASTNPVHFLSWSKGFPPVDTYADEFGYMRNHSFLKNDTNGDTVFILSCAATIYEAEYYWMNGSVVPSELKAYELAPDYYGAVYSAAFATNSPLSHLALQDAAALAAYQLRPEGLAKVFANLFSKAAVAFSAGISVPVQNDREWTRENTYLATRVPLLPLYTLIALKGFYAFFALALALLAVFKTRPSEAHEVKERLTVDGLAAGFFEPNAAHEKAVKQVSDLFHEHQTPEKSDATQKIGLLHTDQGGWLWVTVARQAFEGLGLAEVITTAADQAADAAAGKQGSAGRVGEGYKLIKDIL
ncbi:hypothetical protein A1O7_05981 [Cladophialophora yegresii CBS 114405]|uniref:Uncharacterized protein n=1 Tax=Cladophialophora yegresii CBS 114405 TaxID=1182544 RepID=W9WJ82_9EURO|nr:uncharacterized protein A1O7_05981 [Cladophialophora yegresii CBS 114405]EXJ58554.1 hypothetical protein A1O7_05981 [Cladophialophora yegresii CBS 114405]